MELREDGTYWRVFEGEKERAFIEVNRIFGLIYVQDVWCSPERPEALIPIMKRLREISEREVLRFPLKDGDEYAGLREFTKGFGAEKELEVWMIDRRTKDG